MNSPRVSPALARLLPTFGLLCVLCAPFGSVRAASLDGYDAASPLEGGSWMLSESFHVKVHNFPEDSTHADFLELINRFHTSVRKGKWSVGAQIDMVANAPPADPVDGPINSLFGDPSPAHLTEDAYLVPEKLFVQYRSRRFQMDLGDCYINVGKGIALSLVKRPETDEDTSLRGAKLAIATDPVDWSVFGGWANAQNISVVSINRGIELPAGEFIFGTAGSVRPARWMEIGLHGVGVTFERPDENGERTAVDRLELAREPVQMGVVGASLRFPSLGPVDWHTEADVFFYGRTPEGERAMIDLDDEEFELERGYAIYSGAQVFGASTAFLAEFKRYANHLRHSQLSGVTDNALTASPTLELEEAINPDSQHAVTSNDMTGYRLRMTVYVPKTSHNFFVNFANFFDDADVPGHDREVIFHPYGGVQLFFEGGHHIFFTGGYRGEVNIEDDTPTGRDYGNDNMVHAYLSGALAVKASTLELGTNFRAFHEDLEESPDWMSSETSISWSYKGVLTVSLLMDVTNERASLFGPLAVPGNLYNNDDSDDPLGVFGAAEIAIKPTSFMAIKVFAGANKQGLRCTGGVCRWLPGFNGVRTELTFTL
jgi:hypothetical protein